MIYPTLEELPVSRTITEEFLGYNHNLRIGGGEFYDMKNLTSSYSPVLSPRSKRGVYAEPTSPQGMIAKDALCYVDGADFVINGYHIEMGLSTDPKDCPKKLVSMGAYVIILPDAKWVNTANWSEADGTFDMVDGYGDINVSNPTTSNVTFTLCKQDGSSCNPKFSQSGEPSGKDSTGASVVQNGDLWLDLSSTPHSLKQYSESSGMWVSVPTTYIKIESPGIGIGINQYDGINISGLKDVVLKSNLTDDTGENIVIEGDSATQISELNGSMVVWARDDHYIVVVGILDTEQTIINEVTVSRKMPAMDFVVESENRLWGCRYGPSNNGEVVNEIYACKLGDFKNWNCFMGLSTDSYAASCGTDGVFTGAITHLGYPLFFKENCLHKVYGNYPANYQIQTITCRGVQKGSHDSLAIVNEILYYKSRSGVCAYDGSLPGEISYHFGEEKYSEAVAGSHGNKYYISMKDNKGAYHLFVYDTAKSMWHKEDEVNALCFCSCRDEMYFIDRSDNKIKTIFGSGTAEDGPVEWMAESGIIGTNSPDRKYVSRLTIRMALDKGAEVSFYAQYDSFGEWHHLSSMVGSSLRTFAVPIRPRRCDHFRLRIVGKGDAKIYSIAKTIEEGSDKG